MNFSEALESVKLGSKITRSYWCNRYFIFLMQGGVIEDHENLKYPKTPYASYLAISTPIVYPWTPDQTDLFADDWTILINEQNPADN